MDNTNPLEGKLEPEARPMPSVQDAALLSLAISMKRVADVLDGTTLGININDTIFQTRR